MRRSWEIVRSRFARSSSFLLARLPALFQRISAVFDGQRAFTQNGKQHTVFKGIQRFFGQIDPDHSKHAASSPKCKIKSLCIRVAIRACTGTLLLANVQFAASRSSGAEKMFCAVSPSTPKPVLPQDLRFVPGRRSDSGSAASSAGKLSAKRFLLHFWLSVKADSYQIVLLSGMLPAQTFCMVFQPCRQRTGNNCGGQHQGKRNLITGVIRMECQARFRQKKLYSATLATEPSTPQV